MHWGRFTAVAVPLLAIPACHGAREDTAHSSMMKKETPSSGVGQTSINVAVVKPAAEPTNGSLEAHTVLIARHTTRGWAL